MPKKQQSSPDNEKKPLGTREDALKSLDEIFPEGFTATVGSGVEGSDEEELSFAYTNKNAPVGVKTPKGGMRKLAVEIESAQEEDERLLHNLFTKTR